MPSLTVKSGDLSPAEILAISQAEVSYFSLGEKLTIKLLVKKLNGTQNPQTENIAISEPIKSKVKEHKQTANVTSPAKIEKPIANNIDADKATLQNVGDAIEGMFHSFGSRDFGGSSASVIYLYFKKDLLFIRGTDFAEHKADNKIKAGDIIRITKTAQFKQAKEKDHAKPARFHIDILEKNS